MVTSSDTELQRDLSTDRKLRRTGAADRATSNESAKDSTIDNYTDERRASRRTHRIKSRSDLHRALANYARKENTLILRPAILDTWPTIVVLLAMIAVMVFGSRAIPSSVQTINLPEILGYDLRLGVPLFAIFPLFLFARLFHRLYDERYVLTPNYILEVSGLCSLSIHSTRIRYVHIKDIELNRSLHQRFFDVGDLILASSVTFGDSTIRMRGIAQPNLFKNIIQERTRRSLQGPGHHVTSAAERALAANDIV